MDRFAKALLAEVARKVATKARADDSARCLTLKKGVVEEARRRKRGNRVVYKTQALGKNCAKVEVLFCFIMRDVTCPSAFDSFLELRVSELPAFATLLRNLLQLQLMKLSFY